MLKKLMRRIAATGVSAAVVGGALLVGGGPAAAGGPQAAAGHAGVRASVSDAAHNGCEHRAGHQHEDQRLAHQMGWFCPSAAKRLAVYAPWVKDQPALFAPAAGNRAG
jgi:hypothetical protein